MKIAFQCHECSRLYQVDAAMAGQHLPCSNCRADLIIPDRSQRAALRILKNREEAEEKAKQESLPPPPPQEPPPKPDPEQEVVELLRSIDKKLNRRIPALQALGFLFGAGLVLMLWSHAGLVASYLAPSSRIGGEVDSIIAWIGLFVGACCTSAAVMSAIKEK